MTDRVARTRRHLTSAASAVILTSLAGAAAAQDGTPPSPGERARAAFGGGAPEPTAGREDADAAAAARAAAEELGLELIGARMVVIDGRRLVAARVMEPGGNSNAAFLVQTLVVEPESGEVVGVFPGRDSALGSLPDLGGGPPEPTGSAPTGAGSE